MRKTNKTLFIISAVMLVLGLFHGCTRDITGLELAPYPNDPEVFIDAFGPGVNYEAFANSYYESISIDGTDMYDGQASMSFVVPDEDDPRGWFAGGALINYVGRDLSEYDALTFWVKASMPAEIGMVGFGNDNTGTSKYSVEMNNLKVNTLWKKIILPIPLASKLTQERGMFQMAAAHYDGNGYQLWFDEIQFEKLGTIAHARPAITNQTITGEVGDSLTSFSGATVTMNVAGTDVSVGMTSHYLTFESSNDNVVSVDSLGIVRLLAQGTATLTAKLGDVDADGAINIISKTPPPSPDSSAPVPSYASTDVVSIFSDAYTNHPVDSWSAEWDAANVADFMLGSDSLKKYYNLQFAGILFESSPVDASDMTHFHMDIWTPDAIAFNSLFKIKLVDFGADGVYGGGDDSEHEVFYGYATTPALTSENWISFDIPLSNFTGLTGTSSVAQLIISGNPNIVYVDNIYFHK